VTPELDRLRLPVVAAPMFLISGPDLVVAAAQAGIVGSFPAPNCRTTDELDEWMSTIAAGVADAPGTWAVNLVTHSTNARLAADLEVVAQHRPPVVITALGSPKPVMDTVHGYGGLVIADVVSLKLAHKAVAAGVDGLACVSAGAGGHTGHLSPFAFVSAVREFFDGIVTIGGGISDGHGVAGAVAAGADLVYVGTRFLATEESLAEPEYKQMVVDHGPDDLIVSSAVTGTDASWLRPSLVANGYDVDTMTPPAQREYTSGEASQKRWKDIWAAGQGLQTIRAVEATSVVVDRMEREYVEAADRFASMVRKVR
jgi:nitronate monooxygenase